MNAIRYKISFNNDPIHQYDIVDCIDYYVGSVGIIIRVESNYDKHKIHVIKSSGPAEKTFSRIELRYIEIKKEEYEQINISSEWINECIEYMNNLKIIRKLEHKLFTNKPGGLTEDEKIEELHRSCLEYLTEKDYVNAIKCYEESLKYNNYQVSSMFTNIMSDYLENNYCDEAIFFFEKYIQTQKHSLVYIIFNDYIKIIDRPQIVDYLKQQNIRKIIDDPCGYMQMCFKTDPTKKAFLLEYLQKHNF